MSWIKDNLVLSIVGFVSAILVIIFTVFAVSSQGRYSDAKAAYDASVSEINRLERIALYPNSANRDAKAKELREYKQSIEELQSLFSKYRSVELNKLSTQMFATELKRQRADLVKQFETAGTEIPQNFYVGFNDYQDQLANSKATSLLDYQLKGLSHVLTKLAEAKPDRLISIYREKLPEESGKEFDAPKDAIARNFGFEIAFKGSEKSVREFFTSLGSTEPYFLIVRSLRIGNEDKAPPKISDADFPEKKSEIGAVSQFIEDDSSLVDEPEVDNSKILSQVLGSEAVEVVVRFDLTHFDSKITELPKL